SDDEASLAQTLDVLIRQEVPELSTQLKALWKRESLQPILRIKGHLAAADQNVVLPADVFEELLEILRTHGIESPTGRKAVSLLLRYQFSKERAEKLFEILNSPERLEPLSDFDAIFLFRDHPEILSLIDQANAE
ncbi:MAG: hypothetical protein AAF236_00900, partial [Verrucomicrobiota bacterium]